ncbi:aminoglycoside phosphotransferase family protein [Yunchengibacter salinarum]|uniref:aminoglycoside phosphotransferase family protein n=1 Tax=Yunchengibacter salinarum TaxID=3133399 RepID=UPI0035B6303A
MAADQRLLRMAGWQGASRQRLKADASFRWYERLTDGPRRALMMHAPAPRENLPAYLLVRRHLERLGLRVPRLLAADEDAGLALIEDFGDDTFTRLLDARRVDGAALYDLAVDVLIHLARASAATDIDLPAYHMDALLDEVALLPDWYVTHGLGRAVSPALRRRYLDAWRAALASVADRREALVLRDYHVDNLMIPHGVTLAAPAGRDVSACGLLDFQDARLGVAAYDLVSLVEDARRDVPDDVKERAIRRYLDALPGVDGAALRADMALLGAQRHAKVAGIFTRLSARDGKHHYLAHLPRVLRLLAAALDDPALAEVRGVMADLAPDLPAIAAPTSVSA